jgi:acetyl esterase/lipase
VRKVIVKQNINYSETQPPSQGSRSKLDIYYPEPSSGLNPVLVFIHGGTWMNGSKEIYAPLGHNFAEKGVVTVIANYRLGDHVKYSDMVADVSEAVDWVKDNIGHYAGDGKKITLSGHSAGAHLASLVAFNREIDGDGKFTYPCKNLILLDAFGLNLSTFIREHGTFYLQQIEKIFTKEPKQWEKATPANYLASDVPPILMYIGSGTYPIIKSDNEMFLSRAKAKGTEISYKVLPGKSHVEMVTQLENIKNPLYNELIQWIRETQSV